MTTALTRTDPQGADQEAWPVEGSAPLASVACAVLRRDRASGRATTFEWDDLTLDD
ncbi:hypothetical protein [Curtobacterium sp. MCSS17_007]|uniref:hypothetical protein n=1 Tax=Curtobacterium sp. MCSS17_007 TaxID=2175646 RepID=UPI0015E8C6A1|nr:hypothetical protein [Curtobacterium sp. MCSS17_007]WIE75644.1 hypothetical protein DEJ22_015585 [Curtobacterium sp. MCSS17_007]